MTDKHHDDADEHTVETGHDAATEGVLAAEITAQRDQYLRLAADFENFKRRKAQELTDKARYASEDAAIALLPILDNLLRSLEHAPEDDAESVRNFVSGIEIVVREFESALGRLGVTAIESLGQPFDPALHEAIGAEESAEVDEDTVVTELQRGYRLHDRVLRPAVVRIAHPVKA